MIKKSERRCEICKHNFKPMTEKQWKHIRYEHETMNLKHKKHLNIH